MTASWAKASRSSTSCWSKAPRRELSRSKTPISLPCFGCSSELCNKGTEMLERISSKRTTFKGSLRTSGLKYGRCCSATQRAIPCPMRGVYASFSLVHPSPKWALRTRLPVSGSSCRSEPCSALTSSAAFSSIKLKT